MGENKVKFAWRESRPADGFHSAVCLHGHTMHSVECLSFLPRHLHHVPGISQVVGYYERARSVDFARAWWTPPLTPASALRLEREQIAALGLRPMVSLLSLIHIWGNPYYPTSLFPRPSSVSLCLCGEPSSMRLILGIGGGIAAYKSAELARLLMQQGHEVQAVMTRAAEEFVRPLTFAALTGRKVLTDLFAIESAIEHISVAQENDILAIAPATADLMAKMAHGLADDFLTTLYLAFTGPVVILSLIHI